jgi:hypothetical protein
VSPLFGDAGLGRSRTSMRQGSSGATDRRGIPRCFPSSQPFLATSSALPPAVDGERLTMREDLGAWRKSVTLRSLQFLVDREPSAWLQFVAIGGHFDT